MSVRYQLLAEGVRDHQAKEDIQPDRSSSKWQEYQAWVTAGNTALPADALGSLELADAIARRCEEINMYASGLRNAAVRGRSSGEMASWTMKANEARLYTATGAPADAPTLALTAQVRGITLDALVAKVLDQAAPFLQAEAYIDGVRGRHCDAVQAMVDVRDVMAYDWRAGWPTIPG